MDLASDESCGKAVAKLERHHPGVEMDRTTALRMLKANGWWDEYWPTQRTALRERAKDFPKKNRRNRGA